MLAQVQVHCLTQPKPSSQPYEVEVSSSINLITGEEIEGIKDLSLAE